MTLGKGYRGIDSISLVVQLYYYYYYVQGVLARLEVETAHLDECAALLLLEGIVLVAGSADQHVGAFALLTVLHEIFGHFRHLLAGQLSFQAQLLCGALHVVHFGWRFVGSHRLGSSSCAWSTSSALGGVG